MTDPVVCSSCKQNDHLLYGHWNEGENCYIKCSRCSTGEIVSVELGWEPPMTRYYKTLIKLPAADI